MNTAGQSYDSHQSDVDGEAKGGKERSPIDWALALSVTDGDRDLLLELVEMFPAESAGLLESVRLAVDSGDAELLTRSAHSLKGVARCFGAAGLAACAHRIEEHGSSSDMGAARDSIPQLAIELDRVVDALANERIPD